jgi:hypothetical protein
MSVLGATIFMVGPEGLRGVSVSVNESGEIEAIGGISGELATEDKASGGYP